MKRQIGRLRIPFEVLGPALGMSDVHNVVDVYVTEEDRTKRVVSIIIEGFTMPIDEPGYEMTCIPSIPKDAEKELKDVEDKDDKVEGAKGGNGDT